MTTTRRHIAMAVLILALGVLTSLAIAAAFGVVVDPPDAPASLIREFVMDGRAWRVYETSRLGVVRATWTQVTRDYFTAKSTTTATPAEIASMTPEDPRMLLDALHASQAAAPGGTSLMPTRDTPGVWGQFASGIAPKPIPDAGNGQHNRPVGADMGCGWPCVCLWYQVPGIGASGTVTGGDLQGGWLVRGTPSPRGAMNFRVVPTRPAWIGLTIDAAVFALVWAVVLLAPGALRRALRPRRGQCPRCGYDRAGLPPGAVCPECGAAAGASLE